MIIGIFTGLIWFALVLLAHLAVLWIAPPSDRARLGQLVFLFGFVAVVASSATLATYFDEPSSSKSLIAYSALAGVLAYGAPLTLYLPFYYSIVASLSLQTIILMNRQSDRSLPIAKLRRRFASRQFVAQRLATMARNRFVVAGQDSYSLTIKGRRVAQTFLFFKDLWHLGAGG